MAAFTPTQPPPSRGRGGWGGMPPRGDPPATARPHRCNGIIGLSDDASLIRPTIPPSHTSNHKVYYLELLGMEVRMTRETNPSFMSGVPELLLLRLLRDNEMYG